MSAINGRIALGQRSKGRLTSQKPKPAAPVIKPVPKPEPKPPIEPKVSVSAHGPVAQEAKTKRSHRKKKV